MDIKLLLNAVQKFAIDNSPGILTGIGVAGAVTSAVLTGRAAFRVGMDVNKRTADELPTTNELVREYYKDFIPGAVVLAGTVTCIIAATTVSSRRTAAITAAFKLSEELAEGYKKKVVETLGTQKEEKMRAELAAEQIKRVGGTETVIIMGSEVIFYDTFSGRHFKSEMTKVEKAVNDINHQINNFNHASVSDFYDRIGLSHTEFSNELGWNSDELLEPRYTATLLEDGRPAIAIEYRKTPIRGFDRCM